MPLKSMSMGNNDRLSLDVLGEIFGEFASLETDEDPLEKLLLICRSWSLAARTHRSIWGKIVVDIEHERSFPSCQSYAIRRLELSGSALLDIKVRTMCRGTAHNATSSKESAPYNLTARSIRCCQTAAALLAHKITTLLAGPYGEECKRWKHLSLVINLVPEGNEPGSYAFDALKYPMPNLQQLHLFRVRFTGQELLECPSLQYFSFENVHISTLPDFRNVTKAVLSWDEPQFVDLSSLGTAAQIMTLYLFFANQDAILPSHLPLQTLHIGGLSLPETCRLLQLPSLKILSVSYDNPKLLNSFLDSPGIPFSRIEDLDVSWYEPNEEDNTTLQSLLWRLLTICANVHKVTFNLLPLSMLIKCMWERRCSDGGDSQITVSPWKDRSVQVRTFNEKYQKFIDTCISGKESSKDLVKLAKSLQAPEPHKSWRSIWKRATNHEV